MSDARYRIANSEVKRSETSGGPSGVVHNALVRFDAIVDPPNTVVSTVQAC